MVTESKECISRAYETAAADLASAAVRLQKAKDRKNELRRELNSAECECANALAEWDKRKDALMKIIEKQGTP